MAVFLAKLNFFVVLPNLFKINFFKNSKKTLLTENFPSDNIQTAMQVMVMVDESPNKHFS
jgi:hypothetical protein